MATPSIGGRHDHALVWTGSEMLVWGGTESIDATSDFLPRSGAAYDPASDSWRSIADAPIAGRNTPVAAWSGQELFVWGGSTADSTGKTVFALDGAAYDPAHDRWRPLPEAPVVGGNTVGGWLAGRLVIVTDQAAALYDPSTDRWLGIEVAPIRRGWRIGAIAGGRLTIVAFGDGATGSVEGSVLDPNGWTWSPIEVPLAVADAGVDLVPVGDLVLVPQMGKALDPIAGAWSSITPCAGAGSAGAWSGRYLIGVVQAYDGEAGSCLAMPPAPPRAAPFSESRVREFAVGVWTGREYLTWSGGTGLDTMLIPNDGAVFLPSQP